MISSYENEDLGTPTKTKTHNENEDPLRKQRPPPPYEKEDPSRKRRHITKTSSKGVGITPLWTKIMFMRHTTKTKIVTEILNSEFGTSVVYYRISQQ